MGWDKLIVTLKVTESKAGSMMVTPGKLVYPKQYRQKAMAARRTVRDSRALRNNINDIVICWTWKGKRKITRFLA